MSIYQTLSCLCQVKRVEKSYKRQLSSYLYYACPKLAAAYCVLKTVYRFTTVNTDSIMVLSMHFANSFSKLTIMQCLHSNQNNYGSILIELRYYLTASLLVCHDFLMLFHIFDRGNYFHGWFFRHFLLGKCCKLMQRIAHYVHKKREVEINEIIFDKIMIVQTFK